PPPVPQTQDSRTRSLHDALPIYEKGTGRRLQGVKQIIEAWQGWGKAIPDSKATFVAEHASGDTAVLEVVWKGVHTGPLQTPTGTDRKSRRLNSSHEWISYAVFCF